MPPQRYSMSGPFFAFAAAAKLGSRLSVDWSTVSMVTLGCAASYFCTESATNPFRPAASWSPHHHITSLTGPPLLDVDPLDDEPPPLEPPHPARRPAASARIARAASRRRPGRLRSVVIGIVPPWVACGGSRPPLGRPWRARSSGGG